MDVAHDLRGGKRRLSFANLDLEAIKPFIACAACFSAGISVATSLPSYRF